MIRDCKSGPRLDFLFNLEAPSGFDHLFYCSARFPEPEAGDKLLKCDTLLRQITSGDWQVSKESITVDTDEKIVYFQGMDL